jgi:hypothetical protein
MLYSPLTCALALLVAALATGNCNCFCPRATSDGADEPSLPVLLKLSQGFWFQSCLETGVSIPDCGPDLAEFVA